MSASTVLASGIAAGMTQADVETCMRTMVTRWHQSHTGPFPGWDVFLDSIPTATGSHADNNTALTSLYGNDAMRLARILQH